ncbi:hypothetical protein [Longivirga aurantiaca]|uniref:Helicase XPB/Ssl2 N-terminal domain-containing protein n=1 Tax=Longivirga aurantiaca TaxID=1837743 RepID=A0ABW1SYB1_9ACTN
MYAAGSASPLLARAMVQLASGLFVPQGVAREKYPIDLMATFVTASEIFGRRLEPGIVQYVLERTPRVSGIQFCVELTRRLNTHGGDWRTLQDELLSRWFTPEGATRARALVSDGNRRLVAEQGVLMLLKRVLQWCPEQVPEDDVEGPAGLVLAYFALADDDGESVPSGVEDLTPEQSQRLAAEVVSNQWFHTDQDIVSLFARHAGRWAPTEVEPQPRVLYQRATGLRLELLESVTLAIWAVTQGGAVWTSTEQLIAALDFDAADVQQVLDHLSLTPEQMRDQIRDEESLRGQDWSFAAFEQFPLIADGGGVVVVSPSLLLRRVFSWTLTWDVRASSAISRTQVERFVALIRARAEEQIREAFSGIYPGLPTKRVYTEDEQASAFATGKDLPPRADLVVDDVDSWLVVEITSSMPTMQTIASSSDRAYLDDIEKLLAKVKQIDSSIRMLRDHESALTGHAARARQFIPVLVCTEGFPVNPMTFGELTRRIRELGLLDGGDVMSLRLLSSEDLDAAEAFTETNGVALADLLRDHAASGLRASDLRSYIISERNPSRIRPHRLDGSTDPVFAALLATVLPNAALGATEGDSPPTPLDPGPSDGQSAGS